METQLPQHTHRESRRRAQRRAPPSRCLRAPARGYKSLATCLLSQLHRVRLPGGTKLRSLLRQLAWIWTLRPAPVLLVVPAPARTNASARAANAPTARRAAAPAARQDVRSVPRTVCAKVKRGPRQRRRNAAAASEDRVPPPQRM